MSGFRIEGDTSGNSVEVNALKHLKIVPETDAATNPGNVGGMRAFSENDTGAVTGTPALASTEVDVDFRARTSLDYFLDEVNFNYTAQDTGKHGHLVTTMASAWTAGQFTTNSGSITTTTTGVALYTYAFFPCLGTSTLAADIECGFSAQPNANSFIEFGLMIPGAATTAPTDGVFFRLNSAGLQGIASNNGTEVSTGVFPLANGTGTWTYANNKKYQFIVYMGAVQAQFWVNDGTGTDLLGAINLPTSWQRLCMSSSLQFAIKHRITGGAAGAVLQGLFGAYNVRLGGTNHSTIPSVAGNRMYGSYQGMQGGTQGSLANYANSTNPTAAVPTNTTAALGSGLGGQFWETASLAVNTDGIICSYQVPVGSVNTPGRRLVIRGISLSSYIQAAITGGPFNAQWSLAFGHTAVSLATAESVTTKAPRRLALAPFTQLVTTTQAVNTMVTQVASTVDFGDSPVFVNPGEFVQLVKKHVGTAATVGTIAHVITFVYGWE